MSDWDEAIDEARENLGYGYGYLDEDSWEEVVDEAKDILRGESKKEYNEVKNEYHSYLKSFEWKIKRNKIIKRDGGLCKDCGNRASQVHHLTYDTLHTDEEERSCISLCEKCHRRRHGIPKKIRIEELEHYSSIDLDY